MKIKNRITAKRLGPAENRPDVRSPWYYLPMETKGAPEISKRWLLVFQVLPSDIRSEGKEDGDLESNFEALFFILLNQEQEACGL